LAQRRIEILGTETPARADGAAIGESYQAKTPNPCQAGAPYRVGAGMDDIALGAEFGNTLTATLGQARLLCLVGTAGGTVEAGLM
jgi:hypothetical protein